MERVKPEAITSVDVPLEAALTRPQEPTTRNRDDLMRQATVWTEPAPRPKRRPAAAAVRGVRALGSLLTVAVWLVGIPIALIAFVGWPLPDTLPGGDEVLSAVGRTDLLTPDIVVRGAAVLAWLIWGSSVLYIAYTIFAVAARTRLRLPRVPIPRLAKGMLAGLVPAVAVAVPAQVAAAAPPAATATTDPAPERSKAVDAPSPTPRESATGRRPGATVEHRVRKGDTLWDIADEELGDPLRWKKDIFERNKGRAQPDGRALRDPDIILPGWRLELPADAAAGTVPAPPPPRPVPDDGVSAHPEDPGPDSPSSETPTHRPTATPQPTPSQPVHATQADQDGVTLSDGSWLPWSVATGLTAAAALMWLHRRRRYACRSEDDDPLTLPPAAITAIQRATARKTEGPPAPPGRDIGPQPAATLPLGGIGVTGDGAVAAARAAIVATLAAPGRSDLPGEVVTDQHTLSTLLGAHAETVAEWQRLHVASDVFDALAAVDTEVLRRSRILDAHDVTDLDDVRREELRDGASPPPVLLVLTTPPPAAHAPTKATLDLGKRLRITALIVGGWSHWPVANIAADGRVEAPAEQPLHGDRLAVLSAETAAAALATLRESHTGETAPTQAGAELVPLASNRQLPEPRKPREATASASASLDPSRTAIRAQLRVLGPPRIEDITGPGRPLRAKALEIAVLLACHPDGLSTRDIGEHTEPDARLAQADQRVHTNISNLRHVFARAAGPRSNGYVAKSNGRYRLDPDTVDIDLWRMRDLLRGLGTMPQDQRTKALKEACALYVGPLAQGKNYDWIQPHQETVRRWATQAHLLLAEELLPGDPTAAAAVIDDAIRYDRYNEALYQRAMHALDAQGRAEEIPDVLNALIETLAEIGAEPATETRQLAETLMK